MAEARRHYRLISGDSHVNEPPDLWASRTPAALRDRVPRIERFEQGDAWVIEGAEDPINFGNNACAGLPAEQRSTWMKWEDVPKGGYLPEFRMKEQDQDGVDAEILYPTPRVSNQLFWYVEDPAFHLACIRAYNDWLAEYCSYDTERLWGVALIPNVGVDAAVAELERARALPGMRGAMIAQYPHGGEVISKEDDPFWAALASSGTPLSIHVAFALEAQRDTSKMKLTGSLRFFDAPIRATQMVETGVFDRFPDLRMILVEVDSSWLPYMWEQMDDRFKRTAAASRPDIKRMPSEYFSDNIASTFITDTYGIANRHEIGVTQMLWSSDFPHTGANWPHSLDTIAQQFADVTEDEKQLILAGNALRLYPKG
jgi:predicted TIM-barrel fold metal-dependent hydrolase